MKLNWGIVGLGKIAHSFVQDLLLVENNNLHSVASRSIEKALTFTDQYGANNAFGSYIELFNDEAVDIIYIATPHNSHLKYALQAMNHGKHVLCEKPLAINQNQVKQLVEASKLNNVFLMEAFWTRFNPVIRSVLERIQNGEIGHVNYINADFAFYIEPDEESRLINMNLAGGALMDIGVYPIFLSYLIMGRPQEILASSIKHTNGADLQTAIILKNEKGISNLTCGLKSNSDMIAKIYGTKGNIYIDKRWHQPEVYRVEKNNETISHKLSKNGKGYTYEIEECWRCISNKKTESELWTHQDSLNLISITDEIRTQIGVRYPFE